MEKFVITIGRQFGSGGRELGKVLAEKLGVPFYDKELMLEAAKKSGISPEFFVNNDERAPSFINGLIPFSFGHSPMSWYSGASSISDDSLYKTQSDFIRSLAQQGSCGIVGRTADYVLRDMEGVVNVFLHAEPDDIARRVMARSDCKDREKALALAERTNKLRANYYNFYTDKKWGHASSYDLTFNTSRIPIPDIADLIIAYLGKR